MAHSPNDVAFTPAVRAQQARRGSRASYARWEEKRGFRSEITPELAAFIAAGVVLRQRATTPIAQTIAVTSIVAGAVAAVASIALAAAGISGAP